MRSMRERWQVDIFLIEKFPAQNCIKWELRKPSAPSEKKPFCVFNPLAESFQSYLFSW